MVDPVMRQRRYYLEHGTVMPDRALDEMSGFRAIFLGAVGDPRVPDHPSAAGTLIKIRQTVDLYVNQRPIRLLPGALAPNRTLPDQHQQGKRSHLFASFFGTRCSEEVGRDYPEGQSSLAAR